MITPPTDNLYKFLAISGVVILILSVTFPFSKATSLTLLEAEIAGDYAKLVSESGFRDAPGSFFTKDPKESKLHKDFSNKQAREINHGLREVEQKERHFKILQQEIKFYKRVGIIGGILGLLASSSGFFLWYSRVQRYEDMILLKRTETP